MHIDFFLRLRGKQLGTYLIGMAHGKFCRQAKLRVTERQMCSVCPFLFCILLLERECKTGTAR